MADSRFQYQGLKPGTVRENVSSKGQTSAEDPGLFYPAPGKGQAAHLGRRRGKADLLQTVAAVKRHLPYRTEIFREIHFPQTAALIKRLLSYCLKIWLKGDLPQYMAVLEGVVLDFREARGEGGPDELDAVLKSAGS